MGREERKEDEYKQSKARRLDSGRRITPTAAPGVRSLWFLLLFFYYFHANPGSSKLGGSEPARLALVSN